MKETRNLRFGGPEERKKKEKKHRASHIRCALFMMEYREKNNVTSLDGSYVLKLMKKILSLWKRQDLRGIICRET